MVNKVYVEQAEKLGFETPIQMAVEIFVMEGKKVKGTDCLDLIDETDKAVKVRDEYGNEDWFPKSQIEITEIK